jgi:peptide/nickel transport system substrate-binding protein
MGLRGFGAGLGRRDFLRLGLGAGLGLAAGCLPAGRQPAPETPHPAGGPRYGGVLTVRVDGDPPHFDIHQASTSSVLWPLAPCYNLLVQFDPQDPDRVVPDLAERWEVSPDGKTYTFYLRRGVKFHHGKPLTARDIRASFERIISPPQGVLSPRKGVLSVIDGIEVVDDYTVRFILKRPAPSLLANLAQGWNVIYPEDILQAKGDMKKDVVGTGPFKFKAYTPGVSIELDRNPEYHVPGRPYLDGIKFFVIPDPNTALAAFISGQLLMYRPGVPAEAEEAKRTLGDRVVVQKVNGLIFDSLNLNARRKPWDDPRVRLAVSLAIDRDAAVAVLAQGEGAVGGTMPPGGQWALPPGELRKLPGYAPDKGAELAEARRLLAEAGYAGPLKATLLTRKGAEWEPASVFIRDQLAKIGIDAALNVQETATAFNLLNRGEFDLAPWVHAIAVDDPDAIFGEFYLCESERNYSAVCLPEVDALFQRQSQTLDPTERKRLVWELDRKTLLGNVKVIIGWRFDRLLLWQKVKNYRRHPSLYNNQKFQDVWLEE